MRWLKHSTASPSGSRSTPTAPVRDSTTSNSPPWATSTGVNHRRLHGEITDDNSYVTPAEFEAAHYRQTAPALEAVTQ